MTNFKKFIFVVLILMLGYGCHHDGGGVPPAIPYLLGSPTIFADQIGVAPALYDVTVVLKADGPFGVEFVQLSLFDLFDDSLPVEILGLSFNPGTGNWEGTFLVLLSAGDYYIDDIIVDDGDNAVDRVVGTAWYYIDDIIFDLTYFVAESEETEGIETYFDDYLTDLPITEFSL